MKLSTFTIITVPSSDILTHVNYSLLSRRRERIIVTYIICDYRSVLKK